MTMGAQESRCPSPCSPKQLEKLEGVKRNRGGWHESHERTSVHLGGKGLFFTYVHYFRGLTCPLLTFLIILLPPNYPHAHPPCVGVDLLRSRRPGPSRRAILYHTSPRNFNPLAAKICTKIIFPFCAFCQFTSSSFGSIIYL